MNTTKIEIKSRYSDSKVLYVAENAKDIRDVVEQAVKSGANLSGAYLSGANLSRANLSGANLSGAYLSRAYLSGANLSDAYLSDAYLSGANLSRANLSGANLSGANLSGANLSRANLSGANLSRANLSDAYLSDAYLSGAYLSGANLSGANLSRANLSDAYLSDAYLSRAKFLFDPDPELPRRVAETILAAPEKTLNMGEWHTCETTHCLAGWAVHLSGAAGYALESVQGPEAAGAMLMPSASGMFHASNEQAIEWCKEQVAA